MSANLTNRLSKRGGQDLSDEVAAPLTDFAMHSGLIKGISKLLAGLLARLLAGLLAGILILAISLFMGSFALILWGDMAVSSLKALLSSSDKHFWYLSRSSGIIAYTLFWLLMVSGLLLSTRLGSYVNAARVFALHQFISLVALSLAGIHAIVLLADAYLALNIWQIVLPFAFNTDRWGVALGQLGFWLLFICVFSYYIKSFIGQRLWRWLHFFTFVAYMLVSIHLFMVGSDSQALPLLIFYALSQSMVFVLIGYRLWVLNQSKLA